MNGRQALLDQLRLELGIAIPGNRNLELSVLVLDRLVRFAVAGVASELAGRRVRRIAEMIGHLAFEGALEKALPQIIEHAVFAENLFGLLAASSWSSSLSVGSGLAIASLL